MGGVVLLVAQFGWHGLARDHQGPVLLLLGLAVVVDEVVEVVGELGG
jgi:hypothetical protein